MNTKMKVLSLAMVGMFGYVGSAVAANCPAGPDMAHGGAWTAISAFQGSAVIAEPGYATTACRLDSKINAGAGGAASGQVNWTGATAEPRYRARFLVNADLLPSQALLDTAAIFSSGSQSGGAAVDFSVFGNGTKHILGYSVRNVANPSGYETGVVQLAAGVNVIQFDFAVGSSTFKLWVNNNVEATPTKSVAVANGATLNGIDTTYLGLAGPSPQFVTHFATKPVGFDQFDSRRQTFILN